MKNNANSNPLDRQVGGSHYQSKAQHVSFCQRNRIPWCESAAIKYITRHRSKNGRQDIEKAIHYLELLIHEDYVLRGHNPTGMDPKNFVMTLTEFVKGNGIPEPERKAIELVVNHQVKLGEATLRDAIKVLEEILATYEDQPAPGAELL